MKIRWQWWLLLYLIVLGFVFTPWGTPSWDAYLRGVFMMGLVWSLNQRRVEGK